MDDLVAGVAEALGAAGAAFGPPPVAAPEALWGRVYARLDAAPDAAFVESIELVYEGYLLHYRESRAIALSAGDAESRLLAGDCFYARGLRGIAARGDADAVGLLARLMATCSWLRACGAPFSADDALWAYATVGLVAQHGGAAPDRVAALFDEVDATLGTLNGHDVPAVVARAVELLGSDWPASALPGPHAAAPAAVAPAAAAPAGA